MAETKKTTKAQETVETKAENTINQAASAWTETLRDAGKVVVDGAIAMQDRNTRFAQTVIEQGFKQVEDQTVALHKLYSTVAGQSDARRAAFRDLSREAAAVSISLLATPAKLYRRAVESARGAEKQAEGAEA